MPLYRCLFDYILIKTKKLPDKCCTISCTNGGFMEEFKKKRKRVLLYWVAMITVLLCLTGVVYGIVIWFDKDLNDMASPDEPRDFASEVDPRYTWDLTHMYKDQSQAKDGLEGLRKQVKTFVTYEGNLKDPEIFKKAMALYRHIMTNEEKLRIYANLNKDIHMDDGGITDFLADVEQLDVEITEGFSYFKPELSSLSDLKLQQYLTFEETKGYEPMLEEIIYDRASILSESEDRLMGLLNELDLGYENNYQAFWNRYEVSLKPVAYNNYYAKDDEKRFEATKASMQKQIDAIEVLASNLEGKIKYDNLIAKAYNYNSDLAMVLNQDGIGLEDYEALEKVTADNLPLYHRWIVIKQKMLGLERPYQYHDEQLDLIKEKNKMSYEDAVKAARKAFEPLGKDYLNIFDEAISQRWVDVYPRQSKYTGSYTWGAYLSHPYILINYEDDYNSALTLAHEMGHGIHGQLSAKNQSFTTYENSIFKAEIASTTNEVLFLENQLKTQTGEARKEILIEYVKLITGTIFEQMKASEFEKIAHQAQAEGKDLDGDFFKKTWTDLNAKYYGAGYETSELDGYGWTSIDHLYWNFYMYKYATGLASGYAIATQLESSPEKTASAYEAFLKSGNTFSTVDELKTLKVTLDKGKSLEACYKKLDALLTELELGLVTE